MSARFAACPSRLVAYGNREGGKIVGQLFGALFDLSQLRNQLYSEARCAFRSFSDTDIEPIVSFVEVKYIALRLRTSRDKRAKASVRIQNIAQREVVMQTKSKYSTPE